MLQQQSTDEFVQRLRSGTQAVVVSLSPQSRASLATHYGITPLQVPALPSPRVCWGCLLNRIFTDLILIDNPCYQSILLDRAPH